MLRVKVDASNLTKCFEDAKERFLDGMEAGLKEAAKEIEDAAKQNAPEETGELRQSIQSEFRGIGFGVAEARVYTNNQYAIYVHEGTGLFSRTGMGRKEAPWTYKDDKTGLFVRTSGMRATPFMEDAVNEKRDLVNKIVREEIMKKLGGG